MLLRLLVPMTQTWPARLQSSYQLWPMDMAPYSVTEAKQFCFFFSFPLCSYFKTLAISSSIWNHRSRCFCFVLVVFSFNGAVDLGLMRWLSRRSHFLKPHNPNFIPRTHILEERTGCLWSPRVCYGTHILTQYALTGMHTHINVIKIFRKF